MGITHNKVATLADEVGAEVNKAEWNDVHAISLTKAEFDTACSDGNFVFVGGALGTPSSGVATNLTGTASGLTAGNVTTNANLTGDVTSVGNAATVVKINGTSLAGLATGILKNTTTTGVPSIAVAGDFPTLNQNTTGTAAGLSATLAVTSGGTGLATIADAAMLATNSANTLTAVTAGASQGIRRNAGNTAWEAFTPAAGASGSITASGYTQTTARLLGRNTAATGAIEEITLGTNLSFSGTTLNSTAGSGVSWATKTTTYTAVSGDQILADTSGGSFTITLPATPSANNYVVIKSGYSTSPTKVLTIARNGVNIMNLAEDMTVNNPNLEMTLVYNATTGWTL